MVVYRSSSLLLRMALGDGMAAQAGTDAFPQSNAIQLSDGLVLRIYAEVWSPHQLSHACRLTVGLVPHLGLPTWVSDFMVIAFVGFFMPYLQFFRYTFDAPFAQVAAHLGDIFGMRFSA